MTSIDKAATIEEAFKGLVGLRLFKSWNVFATRMFYFAIPGLDDPTAESEYRLTLECPWRIEQAGRVVVGSEDYGLRADGNSDPAWDPSEMQWGHRQDQNLERVLGEAREGAIFNTGPSLIVESVKAEPLGGFWLCLSGGYVLSSFPTSDANIEWVLWLTVGRQSFAHQRDLEWIVLKE